MKLTPRLVLLFLALTVVPILALGYLAYENGRRALEEEAVNHLISTNLLKGSELDRWVDDGRGDLESLAQRPLVRDLAAKLAAHDEFPHLHAVVKRELVEQHLKPGLAYGGFLELFLLCPRHGIIVASTDGRQEGKYRDSESYYLDGRTRTHVQPIYYSRVLEQPAMTIGTPVRDRSGGLAGVMAGRPNLGELSKIMEQRSGLSPSEDTYLVNKFNFFVTEPRFGKGYALRKAVRTKGVEAGLSGGEGVSFYEDYRGRPVIGAYKWLPEYDMCIISEIDQAEAFGPSRRLARLITVALVGLILTVALLAVFFARTITRPLRQLVEGARRIGSGDLDYRTGTSAGDEIGELGRAFDHMAGELKATTVSRDAFAREKNFSDSVINSLPGVFYLFDRKGRFIRWNRNFEEVTEYSEEEIERMSPLDLFSGDDRRAVEERIQDVFVTGAGWVEALFVSKSGRKTPYLFTGVRVALEGRDLLTGVGIDITERKAAEDALRRTMAELQRSNDELERFAYVASHDLQEPLRMVASYMQLLERRYKDRLDADAREFIGYASGGARRMQQLINDLLAYSRVGTRGRPFGPTNMEDAFQTAKSNLKVAMEEGGGEVTCNPLPTVTADEGQMIQVFQNLIGNALKFRRGDPPKVHVSAEQKEGEWVFAVRDNGIGIEAQYLPRIFAVFQRLHRDEYPGTGMGLAIADRIVRRHGGKMWAASRPGKGSTFYFTIPMETD